MKKLSLALFSLLILTGCQENGGSNAQELREGAREAINAPADYVGANVRAQHQAQVTSARTSINSAVRMFEASEGRYPRNLNELVEKNYLSALPPLPRGASFNYNAQNGQVAIDGY